MANIPGTPSDDNHGQAVDFEAMGHHGPELALARALGPILDQVQRQIALCAEEQANLAIEQARQTVHLYSDRLLHEVYSAARQQVDQALKPVIDSLLDHVEETLDPARTALNSRVDQILDPLLYGYGRPGVSFDVAQEPHDARKMPAAPAEDAGTEAQPTQKKRTARSAGRTVAQEDDAKTARASTQTSRSKRAPRGKATKRESGAKADQSAASGRGADKEQDTKKRATPGRASSTRKRSAKEQS